MEYQRLKVRCIDELGRRRDTVATELLGEREPERVNQDRPTHCAAKQPWIDPDALGDVLDVHRSEIVSRLDPRRAQGKHLDGIKTWQPCKARIILRLEVRID